MFSYCVLCMCCWHKQYARAPYIARMNTRTDEYYFALVCVCSSYALPPTAWPLWTTDAQLLTHPITRSLTHPHTPSLPYPTWASEDVRVIWVVISLTAHLDAAELVLLVSLCLALPLRNRHGWDRSTPLHSTTHSTTITTISEINDWHATGIVQSKLHSNGQIVTIQAKPNTLSHNITALQLFLGDCLTVSSCGINTTKSYNESWKKDLSMHDTLRQVTNIGIGLMCSYLYVVAVPASVVALDHFGLAHVSPSSPAHTGQLRDWGWPSPRRHGTLVQSKGAQALE